ncbi:pyridoxamine 5'-phosphate oxidase family protein [Streptomyces sp. NPDC058739]|uniref:pyridoxamine 5'-phosphate oxidase family protein n=1 Tax=Streptomyces sp. NPDC058739 TaxID=3346618 RepID=UPI00367734B2
MDVWGASADEDGVPWLVPLRFLGDGTDSWMATRPGNPTGRNLRVGGRTRLAFGDTRDVVLIDGNVETFEGPDAPAAATEAFTAKYGWGPRADRARCTWFRVRPVTVRAWHEVRELPQRYVMREGVRLV